jgi:RNA recognition motif-containing protein
LNWILIATIISSAFSVVKEINKINQLELELGVSGASWHDEYKDSAYIFVGGLHFDLTEGDVITIFSQYVHISNKSLHMSNVHTDTGRSWILICLVTKKLGNRKVSDF